MLTRLSLARPRRVGWVPAGNGQRGASSEREWSRVWPRVVSPPEQKLFIFHLTVDVLANLSRRLYVPTVDSTALGAAKASSRLSKRPPRGKTHAVASFRGIRRTMNSYCFLKDATPQAFRARVHSKTDTGERVYTVPPSFGVFLCSFYSIHRVVQSQGQCSHSDSRATGNRIVFETRR